MHLREPTLRSSNCHVEDQVEMLIERSVGVACLDPRILWQRTVHWRAPEFSVSPHVLVLFEVEKEDLLVRG